MLMSMGGANEVSSRGVKDILSILYAKGGNPKMIAEEKGLLQKSNADELRLIAEVIIKDNPAIVLEYKNGKLSALQFFIGQAMKVTKGSANPQVLRTVFAAVRQPSWSLEEELALCGSVLELHRTRDPSRFTSRVGGSVPGAVVPPMVLLPLKQRLEFFFVVHDLRPRRSR